MSDTVQQRAVMIRAADVLVPIVGWHRSEQAADALAAAGLLADPTTSRTDAEQAVIDAAKAWRHWRIGQGHWDLYPNEVNALIAAVDRLAANTPNEEP